MTFTIRPWALEDAPDIAQAINDKRILDNLRDGIPFPYTERDGREFIQSILDAPPDSQYMWAIEVNGKAAGSIGIFRKENIHCKTAELGYFLAQPYWGHGIMTEMVRKACDEVFATTDIVRIFAEPFAGNTASCRVLEKAGFAFEGTMRSNGYKNGTHFDMRMYARIRC